MARTLEETVDDSGISPPADGISPSSDGISTSNDDISPSADGHLPLAGATHVLLYGFILLMPLTGAIARFGMVEASGELHEFGRWVLIPLILMHAAGALAEHFFFRNDSLVRMLKPER